MRASRRSLALAALGLVPLACAVYDGGALGGAQGDATTGGSDTAASGSSPGVNRAGSASSAGGNTETPVAGSASTSGSSAGGSGTSGAGGSSASAGSAGRQPASGGEGEAEGGAASNAGESGTGAAGSGGSGAHAGTGGSGGTAGGGTAAGGAGASSGGGASGTAGTSAAGGSAGGAGTSGNAGSGGAPTGPLCADHPLTARSTWTASASIYDSSAGDTPSHLLDGKITRWTTGKAQSGDEWLQVDFGAPVTLNHINLQQGTDSNDYPRSFTVIVSDTVKDLSGSVRLSGSGKSGVSTAILLPSLATGRYLLLKQTGSSLSWWSAEELEVSCAD